MKQIVLSSVLIYGSGMRVEALPESLTASWCFLNLLCGHIREKRPLSRWLGP